MQEELFGSYSADHIDHQRDMHRLVAQQSPVVKSLSMPDILHDSIKDISPLIELALGSQPSHRRS